MSLGIAFKGPEGIVLAADSRVTLTAEMQQAEGKMILPCTFDNATKLLQLNSHNYAGVVTYGLGAIGQTEPRTAHSYLPEFEDELLKEEINRFSINDYALKLSNFFMKQWKNSMPDSYNGPPMVFLIGGFDENGVYGRVYKVEVPSSPKPEERHPKEFGVTWGGQMGPIFRLIKGFDPELPSKVQTFLNLTEEQKTQLVTHLEQELSLRIPYPFLPLQDCVDLSILLIRTTMEIQNWLIDVRGVGGAIDVATITRTEGFKPVQRKKVLGEKRIQQQ